MMALKNFKDILSITFTKNTVYLVLLFLLPAFTDLLRKKMPGQPNIITPLMSSLFALYCFFVSTKIKDKIPARLLDPVFFWGLYLFIFAILAMFQSFKVGLAVLFLRFIPLLLPFIAYKLFKNFAQFEVVMVWCALLIAFLFPVAIYSTIYGNDSLPHLLKPIESIQEMGRDVRGGYTVCSAIFSTGAIMALSVFAFYFLLLSVALVKTKQKWLYIVGSVIAIFVMYSTVRRSTLYFSLIGFFAYMYLYSKKWLLFFVFGSVLVFSLFLLSPEVPDNRTAKPKKGLIERLNIFIEGTGEIGFRTENVIIGLTSFWLNTKPFGSYLGYTGPESLLGNIPRSTEYGAVETGAAQLIAETGFCGLIFFILTFVWMWGNILSASVKSEYRETIIMLFIGCTCMLLMYLLQMFTMLFGMYISQIVFWASPGIAWALIKKEPKKNRA